MDWNVKPVTLDNKKEIERYLYLRPICIAEGRFLYHYIWGAYQQTGYHVESDFLCM